MPVVSFRGPMKLVAFDQEYVRLLTEGDPETEQHFVSYFGTGLDFASRPLDVRRQANSISVGDGWQRDKSGRSQHGNSIGSAFRSTSVDAALHLSLRARSGSCTR